MGNINKILIYGAGGHGKVVLDILSESGADILGFIDEDQSKAGQKINGVEILGGCSYLDSNNSFDIALGIGDNKIRENIYRKIKSRGMSVVSAVHPQAVIAKDVIIGEGVVIMPGAVVNSGSVLGDGVVVNTGATVDHDCHLERFCQIWPGAHLAGTVKVGEFSYIGTGASVIQNRSIGKNAMIGAGAVVISDQPDNIVAVGIPAKAIRENK